MSLESPTTYKSKLPPNWDTLYLPVAYSIAHTNHSAKRSSGAKIGQVYEIPTGLFYTPARINPRRATMCDIALIKLIQASPTLPDNLRPDWRKECELCKSNYDRELSNHAQINTTVDYRLALLAGVYFGTSSKAVRSIESYGRIVRDPKDFHFLRSLDPNYNFDQDPEMLSLGWCFDNAFHVLARSQKLTDEETVEKMRTIEGFLNNPIVLNGAYNTKQKTPIEIAEDNHKTLTVAYLKKTYPH